jgi:FolB domain-containing protein
MSRPCFNVPLGWSVLGLEKQRLFVRLGVDEQERMAPQSVDISFYLYFPNPLIEWENDGFSDVYCYGRLIALLRQHAEGQTWRTVEYLGSKLFVLLRNALPKEVYLGLVLEKCDPPLSHSYGPAVFMQSDRPKNNC